MALANFFNRAATAASQVLNNFDLKAFEEVLGANVIGVAFDAEAASSEGAATLDLTISLLARLYPAISIIPLDPGGGEMARHLGRRAKSINPQIDIRRSLRAVTVCVTVGRTSPATKRPVIFVGSDGWTALLSRSGPVGSGGSANPFGAGAAACLAAANVFRSVFADQLPGGNLDDAVTLSMLGYERRHEDGDGDIGRVDLGEAHLVGLGAIGNGAVWALSRIPGLNGTLHLVDHEVVDLSNLQRYILPGQAEVDVSKVDVAASAFASGTLKIVPHRKRWDTYVADRNDWRFDRVAVALDTAEDRVAVQGALPRWIVNAWTREVDLGVSRHAFLDDAKACLACLYLPDGKVKDEDEKVAEELGMPEARMDVRHMLHTNQPVETGFIERVAQALGVPSAPLLAFAGQPLRTFYQGAICGGAVFKLTGGGRPVKAVVPMSFQSALAGIMLAADLVKHAAGTLKAPTTSTRINLLRPLASHLHDPKAKDASGRCICRDPDFIDAYRQKYECQAAVCE